MQKLLLLFSLCCCGNFAISKEQNCTLHTENFDSFSVQSFYQLKQISDTVQLEALNTHLLGACLFFACNKLRIIKHKPTFQMNNNLQKAANIHSQQMAKFHFFQHNNPYNSSLQTMNDRLAKFKIDYSYCGENCHKQILKNDEYTYIGLAQYIIECLYNSPMHRINLLNDYYRYSANGVALEHINQDWYILITQDFYGK